MKMKPETKNRIVRNAAVSLIIYALPVVLMFLTFSLTGQRPWQHQAVAPVRSGANR